MSAPKETSPADAPAADRGSSAASVVGTIFSAILFISFWAFWVIFLGGTAAAQSYCVDEYQGVESSNNPGNLPDNFNDIIAAIGGRRMLGHGRQLLRSPGNTCIILYSLPWWIVWFEFICICAAMSSAFSKTVRSNFSMAVIALFAINTALLMQLNGDLNTRTMLTLENPQSDLGKKQLGAARATMAGSVVLTILNLIYILCASSSWSSLIPTMSLSKVNMPRLKPMTHAPAAAPPAHNNATVGMEMAPHNHGTTTPTYPSSPDHVNPAAPPAYPPAQAYPQVGAQQHYNPASPPMPPPPHPGTN